MMKLLIPVGTGAEASVKRQLYKLGYGDCPAISGRIALEGGWEDIARLNVFLRAGERVLIELGAFSARTFDELFEGVFSLPWEEFLTPHACVRMDGKSYKSALGAIKAAGGVAKKAILKRLGEKLGVRTFDERGERVTVGVSILNDIASVTLDTSGDGLHKRSYRVLSYDAPLRETTAAAMVESTYFTRGKPFADLFCGSGTLPIEAAMYALNIAPGAKREFDFTQWKCAPLVLAAAREEAEDARYRGEIPALFASDISEKAISVAKFHAKRAGVENNIRFIRADMRNFTSEEQYGVIVSNPPYGERIGKEDNLFALYRDFGRIFRNLPDWSCYFLSAFSQAERAFGKCAAKRHMSNARIPCTFYSYPGKKPPKERM